MFPRTIGVHESFRNDHANGLCLDDHAKEALNRATSCCLLFQVNGFNDEHDSEESKVLAEDTVAHPELHSNLTKVDVDFEHFFLIGKPQRIPSQFTIELTEHTYLPKVDNPRRDWVSSVAVPAFLAYHTQNQVRPFATIGTGAGLDAIVAVDIFNPERIVATAGIDVHLIAGTGDLLSPLAGQNGTYDLIYENLPNIPLALDCTIDDGQTSATYVSGRTEDIPFIATANLLALHFLALRQTPSSPTGAVLSSIGGRVSTDILLKMAAEAGYCASILTYTWKIQSEPGEIIGGYKKNQRTVLDP
ncbi:hypothetical protein B0H14DRAFT_3470865 [Mycena olivaceomarginata]|nr:hypothetical protein B0H14DRAFT_3470865 [Mycena olivaceomarginata]